MPSSGRHSADLNTSHVAAHKLSSHCRAFRLTALTAADFARDLKAGAKDRLLRVCPVACEQSMDDGRGRSMEFHATDFDHLTDQSFGPGLSPQKFALDV